MWIMKSPKVSDYAALQWKRILLDKIRLACNCKV